MCVYIYIYTCMYIYIYIYVERSLLIDSVVGSPFAAPPRSGPASYAVISVGHLCTLMIILVL